MEALKQEETQFDVTEARFEKIMIKFLLNEPFFSSITRSLRKEMTFSIPTAGVTFVDGSMSLYWNPKFLSELTTKETFGLLKHECYHLIFRHLTTRKQEPHLLWNIATDLAINSTIPRDELPTGGLIPGYPIEFKGDSPLPENVKEKASTISSFIESLPANKAAEWYMEKLQENPEIQEAAETVFGGASGDGEGTVAGFDFHFDDEMSDGEKAMVDAHVKKIVKEAVERADRTNAWGSASSEMRSKIRSMLEDVVDWKSVLHYFCGTKQRANKSRTFKRINKKYPYIHPGRKIKHTSNLAIYIDQSGSCSDEDICLFFGALSSFSKEVKFTVYHFDSAVDENSKYVWKKRQNAVTPHRTRYGGTNFDAVENHFRNVGSEYDGYIVMTDGEASKPKSCISKRCWVVLPGKQLYFTPDNRDTVVIMKR
jgi:predicted metal-dependent peptidase